MNWNILFNKTDELNLSSQMVYCNDIYNAAMTMRNVFKWNLVTIGPFVIAYDKGKVTMIASMEVTSPDVVPYLCEMVELDLKMIRMIVRCEELANKIESKKNAVERHKSG